MANATYADLLGNDILLHYDASDAGSLFTDTAATTAATDGNEVKAFTPQDDASLAVNLTNANGPTYRANYASSGYPALQFDGSNDALVAATTGLTNDGYYTLTAFAPISGTGTAWSRGSTSVHFARLFINTAPAYLAQSVGGTNNFSVSLTTSTAKQVLAMALNDGHRQFDGLGFSVGNQLSGTVSASMTEHFQLGCANFAGLTAFATFAFHEVMIIAGTCEWGQVLRCAKIMRDKWGIADPNALPQKPSGGASRPINPFTQQVIG